MKNIRFFIMDVDGTLTDGKIYMGTDGEWIKAFDIKDGYGIKDILPRYDIIPVIITGRQSKIVELRCRELGIDSLFQGIRDKMGQLNKILAQYSKADQKNYTYADCAYIGDDMLDLPPIQAIKQAGGLTACPCDAVKEVKEAVHFISSYVGGNGAVREFIEQLIDPEVIAQHGE